MRVASLISGLVVVGVLSMQAAPVAAQGNGWDLGEGAIVLPNNQGTRFRVYAENATTISVAGEFNGWSMAANPLTREPASNYWSTTVANAQPGHRYKYLVNGTLWRKDPWSLQVEDSDEAANSVIVDLNAYPWQATSWQVPRVEEVVIYQLHLKGFQYHNDGQAYADGNVFDDFVDNKLDYLEDLGVNCIQVMPIAEFPGKDSWGYNTVFFHALESSYGTPADFQRLVDECHLRGMAVIVDIVHNHTDGQHNTHYWNFDGSDDGDQWGGNGQFYFNDARAATLWGPEPNYGHPRTRARLLENARLFAELYRVDGFRMDAVGFIRNEDWGGGVDWFGSADGDGWAYLRDFNNTVRAYGGGRFLSIAEDIASYGSITQNTGEGGAGFLSQWTETDMRYRMANPSDDARRPNDLRRILENYYPVNYGLHEQVKYHSSHDKVGALNNGPRLPVLIGDPDSWYARRRTMLANATIMFSPGAPLFFMGDEVYDTESFSEHVGQGFDWTLPRRNRAFYEYSRDLVALKTQAPALKESTLWVDILDNGRNLMSWRRWGGGQEIVFIANFGNFDQNVTVPFPSNGRWLQVVNSTWTHYGEFDAANDQDFQVTGNSANLFVPGYSIIAASTTHVLAPGRVWNTAPIADGFSAGSPTTLSWRKTSRAESFDVYVGTSESAVANATTTSPEFKGNQASLTYVLDPVVAGQDVFWRIDAVNGIGKSKSEVFRFTPLNPATHGVNGRVVWTPATPIQGGTATITYLPLGGVLDSRTPVTAHHGFRIGGNNWQSTTGVATTPQPDGSLQVIVSIPADAQAINLAFNHNGSIWDNNGGQDWTITVAPPPTTSDSMRVY